VRYPVAAADAAAVDVLEGTAASYVMFPTLHDIPALTENPSTAAIPCDTCTQSVCLNCAIHVHILCCRTAPSSAHDCAALFHALSLTVSVVLNHCLLDVT
jgi:hypothetical protein